MQRGKQKQLSGGNQKWSMTLRKQRCHRLIQLSFNSLGKAVLLFQQYFSAKKDSVKLLRVYCGIYCIREEHVLLTPGGGSGLESAKGH